MECFRTIDIMDQQSIVSLTVGLTAATVGVLAPVLTYRYSARDKRENLKRDIEIEKALGPDYTSRTELIQSIDSRVIELVRMERPNRLLRRAAISGMLFFAGIIVMTTFVQGESWAIYLEKQAANLLGLLTVLALVFFLASSIRMAWMLAALPPGAPFREWLTVLVFPVVALVSVILWLPLTFATPFVNAVRRRAGRVPIPITSPVQDVRTSWHSLRGHNPTP